jgi:hypothetical protein
MPDPGVGARRWQGHRRRIRAGFRRALREALENTKNLEMTNGAANIPASTRARG